MKEQMFWTETEAGASGPPNVLAKKPRKVSFGGADSHLFFRKTDIVKRVHVSTENNNLENSHQKTHYILSFSHENSSPPPEIPKRQSTAKTPKWLTEEDESTPAAPAPPPNIPDAFLHSEECIKGVFKIPESVPQLPDSIDVQYSLDETWTSDVYTIPSTASPENGPMTFSFIINLKESKDLINDIEKAICASYADDDTADPNLINLPEMPLKWSGELLFRVPDFEDISWSVFVNAIRIITDCDNTRSKTDILKMAKLVVVSETTVSKLEKAKENPAKAELVVDADGRKSEEDRNGTPELAANSISPTSAEFSPSEDSKNGSMDDISSDLASSSLFYMFSYETSVESSKPKRRDYL